MFLNILLATFVGAFTAIVVFGHVLLVTAIWPGAFGKRRGSQRDAAAGAGQEIHQPN
jgi:hypothetical protein